MRYIKVSDDMAICATRVISIMSCKCHQAREILHRERQNRTLLNACGKLAAKSVVILDNGTVISSPKSIGILLTAIEKANLKFAMSTNPQTYRLKVIDVEDSTEGEELLPDTGDASYFDEDEEGEASE